MIKASGVGSIKKRLETFALKDHMAEAQRTLRVARDVATRIVRDAEIKAERLKEEARQRGHKDGFAEGRADGERTGRDEAHADARTEFSAEQKTLVSTLDDMVRSFDTLKDELVTRAMHDVLVLAVAIAERVTKRVGLVGVGVAVANAEDAVRRVAADSDIEIRVHPADAAAMGDYARTLADQFLRKRHVSVVEDDSIGRGGCIVKSATERLDATLSGQFRQASSLLLGGDMESEVSMEGGIDG